MDQLVNYIIKKLKLKKKTVKKVILTTPQC